MRVEHRVRLFGLGSEKEEEGSEKGSEKEEEEAEAEKKEKKEEGKVGEPQSRRWITARTAKRIIDATALMASPSYITNDFRVVMQMASESTR